MVPQFITAYQLLICRNKKGNLLSLTIYVCFYDFIWRTKCNVQIITSVTIPLNFDPYA